MKPCCTILRFFFQIQQAWLVSLYAYDMGHMSCVYCSGNTWCNPASNTRHLQHLFVQKHEDITTNGPKMSQTCLDLFSKPVGVGYCYQPYLRTLWSAGGKSGIKLRCKTWRRNTYYCPTEKASTNVESCLVMSIAHWPWRPCICFTRSGFAPWGAVVYVVLSKNAETRTALVYKRLVLRLQRLHLSQEVVGTTCLTWIFHLCWRY